MGYSMKLVHVIILKILVGLTWLAKFIHSSFHFDGESPWRFQNCPCPYSIYSFYLLGKIVLILSS